MGFFDAYPVFEAEGTVAATLTRLNFRHDLFIAPARDMLAGRRVLDIASHDGRFALAALESGGAAHVTGIEARDEAIARARTVFDRCGIAPERHDFVQGDVFDALAGMTPGAFDTAMVLGFLYHTPRQYEIFAQLDRLGVRDVIVDSMVLRTKKPRRALVEMRWEPTGREGQIFDPRGRARALSAVPSRAALAMWLEEFGWQVSWPSLPPVPEDAKVYDRGGRVAVFRRR